MKDPSMKEMEAKLERKMAKKSKPPPIVPVDVDEKKQMEKKDKKPTDKKNGVDMKELKTKIKEIEKSQTANMKSLDKINKLVAKMK